MRNKAIRISCLAAICGGLAAGPAAAASDDPCVALDAASFDSVLAVIDLGLTAAEADFTAHGASGAYAIAAQYERDLLLEGRQKVATLQAWMVSTGYDATNSSTAGGIHFDMAQATTPLYAAAWWALVSGIYHDSRLAQTAFERAMEAARRANEIATVSGRCYLTPYLTP